MSKVSKKKVIGITGSMGSGKSKVSSLLSKNYPVIDCDKINADLLKKGHKGYDVLLAAGLVSLKENQEINKVQLSTVMFQDEAIKKQVESLLHPLILEAMHAWIDEQTNELVFVEMPILFEIGAQSHFDSVWCVVCEQVIALERLCMYRHINEEEALSRLAHQMPVEEKIKRANQVIYNNGSLTQLEDQIVQCLEREGVWKLKNRA